MLIDDIGLEKINKHINDIPGFAEKIHLEKNYKKADGSYYPISSIKRELNYCLGKKQT